MAQSAADILIETLQDWDVDVVFGLPGDGINGIMEALRRRQDRIRFVQVRHEEAAAFMACAYAKFTGRLGVFTIDDPARCGEVLDRALATPGPVLIEAVVDPFEPPLPAKITLDQATKFATSLVRGEPNREKIALTILGDRVRELV